MTDDDSVLSGSVKSVSDTFTVKILPTSCLSGSYSDLELQVGEEASATISDFENGSCSSVSFSMTANGAALPAFMSQTTSTLSVSPISNDDAGDFTIEVTLEIYRSSETTSFTVTVEEIEEKEAVEASEEEIEELGI